MKKIFKSMTVSMLLVLTLATSAFANPVNDIREELIGIGVPTNYVANAVEYLQKTTISDAQYKKVMNYIDNAKGIVGNVKDLSTLSSADKAKLQNLAVSAGNVLGVNVEFGKNNQGVTVVVVTDQNGGTLLQLTTQEVSNLVENFDATDIVEVIEAAVEFSNDQNKGDYNAVSGELNKTAAPYGNIMVIGAGLVACAGAVFVYSRRQFA